MDSIEPNEEITKEQLLGVIKKTRDALNQAGLTSLAKIASTPPHQIQSMTGLSQDIAEKVSGLAIKASITYQTAEEYYNNRQKNLQRLKTGSRALDEILGGGFETGVITELIGEFGSGKTQICYVASVLVQQPIEEGGLNGKAFIIDTEGTFLPERIVQIAETRGLNVQTTLRNIVIVKAHSSRELEIIVRDLPSELSNENYRLLVVDSMASHFRSEYVGRETLAPRQQKLGGILGNMLRTAENFNMVALVTNQLQGNPSGYGGDKPALGHVMAHSGTHRVKLRKGRQGVRVAKIIDSPYLPEYEAAFVLSEKGIDDTSTYKQDNESEEDEPEDA